MKDEILCDVFILFENGESLEVEDVDVDNIMFQDLKGLSMKKKYLVSIDVTYRECEINYEAI